MRLAILSDIHANLSALQEVCKDMSTGKGVDSILALGDIVDYGMRPNECIEVMAQLHTPICVNLFGNHEDALLNGKLDRFSSERGRAFSKFTLELLSAASLEYLHALNQNGSQEFLNDGHPALAIHGCIGDPLWGTISPKTDHIEYAPYDYVFSGHSHRPHNFAMFYTVKDESHRNQKKTVFINPGSVGQPRNHNPFAQYAILDMHTQAIEFRAVEYDIAQEQKLYDLRVSPFYSERLLLGV